MSEEFTWSPQPEAAAWLGSTLSSIVERSAFLTDLSERMLNDTGTRLFDWLDHVAVGSRELRGPILGELGCQQIDRVWVHPGGLFPAIHELPAGRRVAIRTDDVDLFVKNYMAGECLESCGSPRSGMRRVLVSRQEDVEVWLIQQRGTRRWSERDEPVERLEAGPKHLDSFRQRRREFDSHQEAFRWTRALVEQAIAEIGVPLTCHYFFQSEREYWQSRNQAAQVQKARQDQIGLGWANHDHHTYRSSRQAFSSLISILELLGFECRERFYAGREAGWGAQVLQNRKCRVVVFADVDLAPEEISGDFAHQPLAERNELGTVGLWCALHGEAFFEAGMHHLECQFDFDAIRRQLAQRGIETMPPFTDFPHLKQAFTAGERWPVPEKRLQTLQQAGQLTDQQAHQFRDQGAIGSHLEVLERNQGYNGFNQTGISEIIRDTDPRHSFSDSTQTDARPN